MDRVVEVHADAAVEVLGGVPADARVVAGGGAFLSDGAQVTVVAAAASATSR